MMTATLTIIRYRKRFIPFALLAMALHRIPFWLNSNISFFKLLGCGRNGGFGTKPDWQQWGILSVQNNTTLTKDKKVNIKDLYGGFIAGWCRLFACELWTLLLEPLEGHGLWDGKKVFGELLPSTDYGGKIAVLTRATIRTSQLKHFRERVNDVNLVMKQAKGFVYSIGIGEMPLLKQATFSIWESKADMKAFAYQAKEHTEVIKRTRAEKWYSEEMFVRFRIISSTGTIRGLNPIA